ncbi:hypothetical protein BGX27_002911, partial [Mortierella sp. AM989]
MAHEASVKGSERIFNSLQSKERPGDQSRIQNLRHRLPQTLPLSQVTTRFQQYQVLKKRIRYLKSWLSIKTNTELTIKEIRKDRFSEDWVHDLLYDRLKLLRTGLNPKSDENTYASFWVVPDFVALQTGVNGLISSGFANENHYIPSAWRRSLARDTLSSKGTNVDVYYLASDGYIDVIFENIGPPTCRNHVKHQEDKNKSWRNAADALLERFYNSSGLFEIAKEYKIICVIVF